jgi:hypothetical protein
MKNIFSVDFGLTSIVLWLTEVLVIPVVKVHLEEIQETLKNVSTPTDPIQEVQDVVPPDVEAPAPRRSIRAHRETEKFTLLTTKQGDILLLDNDEPMT